MTFSTASYSYKINNFVPEFGNMNHIMAVELIIAIKTLEKDFVKRPRSKTLPIEIERKQRQVLNLINKNKKNGKRK